MSETDRSITRPQFSWYERLWFEIKFHVELAIAQVFPRYGAAIDLFWLHYYGFYPVAICESFIFERCFIFKTKDEAQRAQQICEEKNNRAIGWYYDRYSFKERTKGAKYFELENLNIWWIDERFKYNS